KDNFLYLGGMPFTGLLKKKETDGYAELNYSEGHVHGIYKSFYASGRIKEVSLYNEGKLNGRSIHYWPNGTKKMNVNYVDGEMDGIYEEWDNNGLIAKMKTYYKGKLISIKGRAIY
ncbi:MAG: hypothetical protein HKP14_09270, partial [Bacteroidia bacterium]|nr:hypothetical protein [Bacteroidia bacterium]